MDEKFVLLVEDEEDDVNFTKIAFEKCQILQKLVVVWDGQEALDFLFGQGKYAGRNISQLPAAILLDLKLPNVSGIEVLKQVRLNQLTQWIPVIILTSSTNHQEEDECERSGANRYYRKPASFTEFKKIMEEIKRAWLTRDRILLADEKSSDNTQSIIMNSHLKEKSPE
jgi:two-component system, response regulator